MRHGNVDNRLFRYGKRHSQRMEKQRAAFPHPANSVSHSSMIQPVTHIPTTPTTAGKHPSCLSFIKANEHKGGGLPIRNVNTGYMVRAPTSPSQYKTAGAATLQLNTAVPQERARRGDLRPRQLPKLAAVFLPFFGQPHRRQKGDFLWHFSIRQSEFCRPL